MTAAGFRAVAPDFIGFGRSDKLAARADYSYDAFVGWLREFVEILDLSRITLVCQDWGGPIGLSVLAQLPQRFAAVLAANTLLPNCEPPPRGSRRLAWRDHRELGRLRGRPPMTCR